MSEEIQQISPSTTLEGVGQTPIEAPAPTVEATPSQEELDFARRFTALTRKERDILAREERMRGELQSVQEWRKEQEVRRRSDELIASNPLKFLEEKGWNFNQLADFALNDNKPTQNQVVESLQKQIEDMRREREEEKTSKYQSEVENNIRNYKANIRAELEAKADKYELLNQFEQFDAVYDAMNDHFIKTTGPNGEPGEILDIDEVAASVEKYLDDQLDRAAKTKKFTSRFAPSVKEDLKMEEPKSLGDRDNSPRTLTNASVSGSRSGDTGGYLDEESSKRRAAKLLEEMWARGSK